MPKIKAKPITQTTPTVDPIPNGCTVPVDLRRKLTNARTAMQKALVERDDEIDAVLTALVAGENVLLVGAPGTAKSLLLDSVMRLIGGSTFTVLLTKFTTPEEVFGPVSVAGLKEDRYRRITTGKLPEADGAFIDELFKASSAILNTLLRILNERVYDNGSGGLVACPLKLCVAASNEWPQDQEGGKELGALFDRFVIRKTVRAVSPRDGRKELLRRAVANDDCKAIFTETLTPSELTAIRNEAKNLPWSNEAKKGLWQILEELAKEGINPGDRRLVKAVGVARAAAYLNGHNEVLVGDLEVLANVLWDDPAEQPRTCAKVVGRIANPLGSKVTDLLMQAEDVLDKKTDPAEAVKKLQNLLGQTLGMAGFDAAIAQGMADAAHRDPKAFYARVRSNNPDARVQKAVEYLTQSIRDAYNNALGLVKEE